MTDAQSLRDDDRMTRSTTRPIARPVSSPPPATAGLNRLDQSRAASIADEGGAAAATIESQEGVPAAPATIPPDSSGSKKQEKARTRE